MAALGTLIAVGVGLRAALSLAYAPAVLHNPDSGRYLRTAFGPAGLFSDPFAPAGYALFLRLGRALSAELWVTVAVQHALGLGTAALLFAAVRRLGAPVGAAAVPAAVVLLSADQLYLEHALLSEAPFTFLVAAGLYAAARAASSARALPWTAGAGALLGAAALTRGVGLALVPLAAGWAAVLPGERRRRLALAGGVLAGAVLPVGGYLAAADVQGGQAGLFDQGGWSLYARAAPFARCGAFQPPADTSGLCERSAPESRSGGSLYLWDRHHSPARRLFGFPPKGDARVGAFARAAIAAQPLDYGRAVGGDLLRVVAPDWAPRRNLSGGAASTLALDRRSTGFETQLGRAVDTTYAPATLQVNPAAVGALAAYQRVSGALLRWVLLLGGAVAGLAVIRADTGAERRGILLLGGAALVLLVVPVALFQFTPRFGVPALGPGAAAGVLGAWSLARSRHRERRPTPAKGRGATTRVWNTPAP